MPVPAVWCMLMLAMALDVSAGCVVHANACYGVAGGTPADAPCSWFYAVDNKSRKADDDTQPSDPVFMEVRARLDEIVRNDDRTVPGLDGKPTRYLEFEMPLQALQMLGFLRAKHGRSCKMQQVHEAAKLFSFTPMQVTFLLPMFKQLGVILYFPDVTGCGDFIALQTQWVIDAMSCVIREEEHHGSLLQELLDDDPCDDNQVWHRTPTRVVWNAGDVKRGWFLVDLLDFIWGHRTKYRALAATETELDFLKKVLTHFHLVQRVVRRGEEFLVVPALVQQAPLLPRPPLLHNNEQLPEMPASVAWELHRVRREYGPQIGMFDFRFDFKHEDYFPDELFESLACAVATKLFARFSNNSVQFLVDFHRHEATFEFNEHFVHAKKYPLSMRVFSVNCSAGNHTTAQYSLQLFQQCAAKLLRNTVRCTVHLGYVDGGKYTYASLPASGFDSVASAAQRVWNGKPDLTSQDRKYKNQVRSHQAQTFHAPCTHREQYRGVVTNAHDAKCIHALLSLVVTANLGVGYASTHSNRARQVTRARQQRIVFMTTAIAQTEEDLRTLHQKMRDNRRQERGRYQELRRASVASKATRPAATASEGSAPVSKGKLPPRNNGPTNHMAIVKRAYTVEQKLAAQVNIECVAQAAEWLDRVTQL